MGRQRPLKLCKRGHELEGGNVFVNAQGARVCRSCRSDTEALYYWRRRVKRLEALSFSVARSGLIAKARDEVRSILFTRTAAEHAMLGCPRH
jgi:hypothetical protein